MGPAGALPGSDAFARLHRELRHRVDVNTEEGCRPPHVAASDGQRLPDSDPPQFDEVQNGKLRL
jgi:hypothetical protein